MITEVSDRGARGSQVDRGGLSTVAAASQLLPLNCCLSTVASQLLPLPVAVTFAVHILAAWRRTHSSACI
jgi:hypothetical protein